MMVKVQKIQDFFQKHADETKSLMVQLEVKRKKMSFVTWAEWHAMDYIRQEMTLELWHMLQKSLIKLVGDGKSDEDIVQWVRDVREQFVDDVLKSRARHSTSQLANMIEAERVEVWKSFAGASRLDSESLVYLLGTLDR